MYFVPNANILQIVTFQSSSFMMDSNNNNNISRNHREAPSKLIAVKCYMSKDVCPHFGVNKLWS